MSHEEKLKVLGNTQSPSCVQAELTVGIMKTIPDIRVCISGVVLYRFSKNNLTEALTWEETKYVLANKTNMGTNPENIIPM